MLLLAFAVGYADSRRAGGGSRGSELPGGGAFFDTEVFIWGEGVDVDVFSFCELDFGFIFLVELGL